MIATSLVIVLAMVAPTVSASTAFANADTESPSTPQNLVAVIEANGDVALSWD